MSNRDRRSGDRWHCHGCDGEVEGRGPWCDLYRREGRYCVVDDIARFAEAIDAADAKGDGALVNALCEVARGRFGIGVRW